MFSCSKRVKRVTVTVGIATFSVAVYQADRLRRKYLQSPKLAPPTGPHFGSEKWVHKFNKIKDTLKEEKDDVVEKTLVMLRDIKVKFSCNVKSSEKVSPNFHWKDKIIEKISILSFRERLGKSLKLRASRKVKLVVLGDSLVCGVGCDGETDGRQSSPVLPLILAKVLSIAMRADVEWSSLGIIGGTVADIREILLPEVRERLLASIKSENSRSEQEVIETESDINSQNGFVKSTLSSINQREVEVDAKKIVEIDTHKNMEIIIVVICGLNDWKKLMEHFPFGQG